YSVNVITMLGLGVAVDYSLLVISRFREERAAGLELPDAIERTLATAGRTVAFSGLTVAAALCGLLAFAEPFLRSLAGGGVGGGGPPGPGGRHRPRRVLPPVADRAAVGPGDRGGGRGPAGAAGGAVPPPPAGELGPGVAAPVLGVAPAVGDGRRPLRRRRHRPGGGGRRVGPR